jgi:hypothetical protein
MPRLPIAAAAMIVLSAGFARAQYSGPFSYQDNHTANFSNILPDYEGKRSYADIQRDLEIERQYRATVNARIPDKKPSKDPWRNIRSAPVAEPYDRHRPM